MPLNLVGKYKGSQLLELFGEFLNISLKWPFQFLLKELLALKSIWCDIDIALPAFSWLAID